MEEKKYYSSRIIKSYVEYLKKFFPDIDANPLLKHAGIEIFQLDDEGHWMTQEESDRFHEMLVKATQDPDISRKVGRFSVTSRASGAVGQYILGFINPATAYGVMEKINSRLSRAANLKTRAIASDKIEAKVTLEPGVNERLYQCNYRLGAMEALAKLSTNKLASIEHPVCVHRGGDCCLYVISWEKTPSLMWKRIRNYISLIGLGICIVALRFVPTVYWDAMVLLYFILLIGLTLQTEHLEKKELLSTINTQADAADRLLDQINSRYNEALLIQEIGQAASMAALLLAAGETGMRYGLPHARILIHQPLGGVQGQVTDVNIQVNEMLRLKEALTKILSKHTGQPIDKVSVDTERDYFMAVTEAQKYGIIDHVIAKRPAREKEGEKADAKN